MIEQILITLTNFIISLISSTGYAGIILLMGIESAAVPLPSEVIMPFSGFLVSQGKLSLVVIAVAGAIGSVLGSWVTYWIGKYGGRPLITRYGKYVLITEHDLALADGFFAKFGVWSTFFGRMLPIVRTYISIPAGISRVRFWPFTAACFSGSFLWSLFLGWVGLKLGQNWESLRQTFRHFEVLIVGGLFLGLAWWIRRHLKNRVR